MSAIENAKSILPLVPGEVFDGFFAPIINDIGWPFTNINDHLCSTDWYRILYPLSLLDLHNLAWERRQIILDWNILCHASQDDINLVIQNKTEDVWALTMRPTRTLATARAGWLSRYAKREGHV